MKIRTKTPIAVLALLLIQIAVWLPPPTVQADDCPAPESSVETQLGSDFSAILQGIKSHLEQGKPPTEIPARFRRKSENYSERYDVGIVIADLTGTGDRDIVVKIIRGDGWSTGSSGAFVFRECSDGQYGIHYISTDPTSGLRFDYTDVDVIPVRLRGDRHTQLLVRYGSVASGRCKWEVYMVVGFVKNSWTTYLRDEVGCGGRDVTYVTRVIARDPDATGRKGLMLLGDQWTGWGIYQFAVRPVRVVYSWQDDKLRFEKRVYRASVYRFHVLQDAQIALDAKDLKLALQKYQQAATDPSLKNSVSAKPPPIHRSKTRYPPMSLTHWP